MSSFSSLNKVMLLGRLGQDPELVYSQSEVAICKFSVATTESVKKGDSWEEKTDWHNVVCFAKLAENSAKFLKKGSLAFVEGRLQTQKYQDRDGNDRYKTEVIANSVKFLDSKEKSNGGFNLNNNNDLPY